MAITSNYKIKWKINLISWWAKETGGQPDQDELYKTNLRKSVEATPSILTWADSFYAKMVG